MIIRNYLISYLDSRDNNFNLIRFIAATMVLFSHCFPLLYGSSDTEPLKALVGISFGTIAVDIFFISSGFLIANSLFAKKDLASFFWARFLRIYPGLFVALIFCIFIVGLFFTHYSTLQFLTDTQTYIFFFKNAILFFGEEQNLPGVFHSLPWKGVVNGSLWTLPFEIKAYCLLVVLSIVIHKFVLRFHGLINEKTLYLFVPLLGMLIYISDYFFTFLPISYFAAEDFRLYSLFFIGTASYIFRSELVLSKRIFYVLLLTLIFSSLNKDIFFVIYNIAIFYIIFYIAYVPKGKIRKFNQCGDYSYGIYIYAWPVQQSIIALMPNTIIIELCIYSFTITLLLSYFSWHFIEKKALNFKSKIPLIKR